MVEKMKLLHITGPKQDIDRVADRYLSRYEIHFEHAVSALGTQTNVRPYVETNVYKDTYAKAKMLEDELLGEASGDLEQMERMEPQEAAQAVETACALAREIQDRQDTLRKERTEILNLMAQIEPFRELDYEFKKILKFHFIDFRFGRILRDYYQKLETYFHDTDHALFYQCHSDENYVWGVYFVPQVFTLEVDAVCLSFHFERLQLPDSFDGTPDAAYLLAGEQLKKNEEEEAELHSQLHQMLMRHQKRLLGACASLKSYCDNFEIRKLAACARSTDDGQEYYILYGWISERDAAAFEREIASDGNIHVIKEDVDKKLSASPPTKLRNPKVFKPFQMFVEMYGLPSYNEMDPTVFIALTYTLMFGIMFGDVGQGMILAVGGFLLYRLKGINLAAIVSFAGVWSTVFGFLYGSIFGFEEILEPVWMRPMDNIMTTLYLAIGFGMALILIAMVIHIINGIRAREPGSIFFSQSGLAGIICYGFCVVCILLFMTGHPIPAAALIGAAVGIPLIAIMLKEPLSNLLERRHKIFPEGSKVMFFVEALVELFDVVLSYATNSISFVRVGAFALSHAGMMGVVMTLAGYESGSPNWVVIVLGNIVVTALEGLVVGIQVLRLEYYEMFSRFYKGTGKPFRAFFGQKNETKRKAG